MAKSNPIPYIILRQPKRRPPASTSPSLSRLADAADEKEKDGEGFMSGSPWDPHGPGGLPYIPGGASPR